MSSLGPFPARPHLSVAVSGGADSMALCLLADAWARERGGGVLALIVDHGLRTASAAEALQAAAWLAARGIDSEILVWSGEKPASSLHARARAARYRLLADRCLARGILHLLVGHHLQDQAETVLLRAGKGSGASGLAGMSALVETGSLQILRPLLAVPKARLFAYLAALGQDWLEDPSNIDPAFARPRVRLALVGQADASAGLVAVATGCRELRRQQDEAVATLLARHCRLHPLGFATLDSAILGGMAEETLDAALGRLATTIGGKLYPPTPGKLARLRRHLLAGHPAPISLGRCIWRLSRHARGKAGEGRNILIFREVRGLPLPTSVAPGAELEWDGRFLVRVGALPGPLSSPGFRLEALGGEGWREALALRPSLRDQVPRQVAATLPSLRDAQGLVAVPGLALYRECAAEGLADAIFRPRRSLSGSGYYLA